MGSTDEETDLDMLAPDLLPELLGQGSQMFLQSLTKSFRAKNHTSLFIKTIYTISSS